MADEEFLAPDEPNQDLKKDTLSQEDVRRWLSRAQTASKNHVNELSKRYRWAKDRYNSRISTLSTFKHKQSRHGDVNFLYKVLRDFISSLFNRNPRADFTSRDESDEGIRNIENLEQKVNDDVKDDRSLKSNVRQILLDEGLAGFGALWIDYDYRDEDAKDGDGQLILVEGTDTAKRKVISDKVITDRIRPENLIRPPWLQLYKWRESPYLGYVDIVTLEKLKDDNTLDQAVVKKLQGKTHKALQDTDNESSTKEGGQKDDDIKQVKVFYLFIKGSGSSAMKRLVLSEENTVDGEVLSYGDWEKGHGVDGKGYPIHILALNDSAEGFIPPSEAWILEPLLQMIDYIFQKLSAHVRKSGSRTLYLEGGKGIKKAVVDKLVRNIDQEYIGLKDLPPGTDVRSLVTQIVDQDLSIGHISMLDIAKTFLDQLSRQPTFSQNKPQPKKTATEVDAERNAESNENSDYVDKFTDFWTNVLWDWGKLLQTNFQGLLNLTIIDPQGGEPEQRREIDRDKLQGDIKGVEVNTQSFLLPNKEVKRLIAQRTIADAQLFEPMLRKQGKQLNGVKMVKEYFANVEMRNVDEVIIDRPTRNIEQQLLQLLFRNVPFNPEELGEDADDSLQTLLRMFGDGQLMRDFEAIRPGVSLGKGQVTGIDEDGNEIKVQQDGEIIQMLQILGKAAKLQKQRGSSLSGTSKTDVGANAALNGAAQR